MYNFLIYNKTKNMKKMIYGFLGLFMLASVGTNLSFANTEGSTQWGQNSSDSWWFNDDMKGDKASEDGTNSFMLNGTAGGIAWAKWQQGAKLLDSVKKFINWALGMLATVALVLCLWGGFNMMTAGGDETKYKNGINILKKAAIGLVVIGGAWMLVSVVMWLIGNVTS